VLIVHSVSNLQWQCTYLVCRLTKGNTVTWNIQPLKPTGYVMHHEV